MTALATAAVLAAIIGLIYYYESGQTEYERFSAWTAQGLDMETSTSTINPQDESTWPSGNRIWNICHAAALAEGYNIPGSVPQRCHNPGDISDGADTFGYEPHSGSKVTIFPDDETGFNWLYNKFANIVNGLSDVYPATLTWTQVAQKYAGNWQPWLNNVCGYLGVDYNSTPRDYVFG